MRTRRGSVLIIAMLFLVLFSGIGVYVVSLPVRPGDAPGEHHRAAVARNMADAGVHAAIARFPAEIPERAPVERRFPIGPGVTGRYAVSSRKTAPPPHGTGPGRSPAQEEYVVISEGGVLGASDGKYRVRALVRYGPLPRARIIEWTGSPVR